LEERVVWRHAAGGPYVPTGIAYEGLLYVVTDGGMLSCYRVETGERLYHRRLNGTFSASLLAGAGKIYITSERGDVYVIRAGEEYALISTNRMHGHCLATPAIAYDSIYIRTDSELYCVGGIESPVEESIVNPPVKPIPSPSDTLQDDAEETL
jgi:outer membrane protein assembly factor BamB